MIAMMNSRDVSIDIFEKIYLYEKKYFKEYKDKFTCSCNFTGTDKSLIEHLEMSEYPDLHNISDLLKRMWRPVDVGINEGTLNSLVIDGYLVLYINKLGTKYYRIGNIIAFREILKQNNICDIYTDSNIKNIGEKQVNKIPDDLFSTIVGYDNLKKLMLKVIKTDSRVHVLLRGTPATGKSLFLYEIMRLSGCNYLLGGSTTKVGIEEYLIEEEPKYLIIDEIDKMQRKDFSALLGLMEDGTVSITKHNRRTNVKLDTKVFGACNNIKNIPDEIKSRFSIINLKPYQDDQLNSIIVNILTIREGKNRALSEYIADKCIANGFKDVREAIRISRLSDNKKDVDDIIKTMKDYN